MNATTTRPAGFDDLEDDLEAATGPAIPEDNSDVTPDGRPLYVENCPKCGGTGWIRSFTHNQAGRCFKCQGQGTFTFTTSPEQRAKGRQQRRARVAKVADDKLAAFEAQHPDVAEWWTGSDFELAVSFRAAVQKWGHLTERQLATAQSCAAKLKAAKAEREARAAQREANAVAVDVSEIARAMELAMTNGIKRPMVRLARFKFSRAPESGNNAGAVYVKDRETDTYMGKIAGGRFFASRECNAELEAMVVAVASNPKEAAIAYGKQYGQCAICGRELSDADSVKRGIGPICADRYGF